MSFLCCTSVTNHNKKQKKKKKSDFIFQKGTAVYL